MEDYDDVREALKLVPGGDVGWQVTQTRLAVSLLTALAQSLDRRICEIERDQEAWAVSHKPTPQLSQTNDLEWKTRAVTYMVWGFGALISETVIHALFSYLQAKLHIGGFSQ